jgi:hypothetical protein
MMQHMREGITKLFHKLYTEGMYQVRIVSK